MEMDALSAGVYGGLKSKESIKLLVCYIINNIDTPLPRNHFCDEMHAEGIANYFELAEAFSDLTQKELIVPDKSDCYTLTEIGKATVTELKNTIPTDIRRRAFYATHKMINRLKYQEQTNVSTTKLSSGEYLISCSILEGKKEMMTVKLNVPDFETAQRVKNIFWDSPEIVYSGVLKLLTHNEIDYKEKLPKFLDK